MKTMKGSQRTHELQNVELLTYEIISLKCCVLCLSKLHIRSYEITYNMTRCLMYHISWSFIKTANVTSFILCAFYTAWLVTSRLVICNGEHGASVTKILSSLSHSSLCIQVQLTAEEILLCNWRSIKAQLTQLADVKIWVTSLPGSNERPI